MDNQNNKPLENLGGILRAGMTALGGKAEQASDYIDQALKNVQIPDSVKASVEDLAAKGGDAIKNLDIQGALGNLQGNLSEVLGNLQQRVDSAQAGQDADVGTLNLVLEALERMDQGQLAMVRNKIDSLINQIG